MQRANFPPADPAVSRAIWPELMFSGDVALALNLRSESAARRAIHSGRCGPFLRIGRRLAVRRDSLLDALAAREIRPPVDVGGGMS